ncbi:MAG: hypothetical protein RR090_06455 [Niameybacter sp.]|uniref:hypothetical protein n=1 Tax=Niameybacter sp. TaxID=2033640 RepID=UPI002FC96ECA
MESEDSDSETDTDKLIRLSEKVYSWSPDKEELSIVITYDNQRVGYLNAVIMDVGSLKSGGFRDDKLECQDKEIEEELLTFYKSLSADLETRVVFYITDFFLEKQYRGMGIGGDILNLLPEWLNSHFPEVNDLYLFPYPLEKSNGKVECVKNVDEKKLLEMRTKLIRFYLSHGLKKTRTQFLYRTIRPVA